MSANTGPGTRAPSVPAFAAAASSSRSSASSAHGSTRSCVDAGASLTAGNTKRAWGRRAPGTSVPGGYNGAEGPEIPASSPVRATLLVPVPGGYAKPRSSTGNWRRRVEPDSAHIFATAARRARPIGLSPSKSSPHCARPNASPASRSARLAESPSLVGDPASAPSPTPAPERIASNPRASPNGSGNVGNAVTASLSAAAADAGRPSAAGMRSTCLKFSALSLAFPVATGFRSRVYDARRSGPPPPPGRSAASFHARLWASCTPVFIPKPPAGGNRCAASPHSATRPR